MTCSIHPAGTCGRWVGAGECGRTAPWPLPASPMRLLLERLDGESMSVPEEKLADEIVAVVKLREERARGDLARRAVCRAVVAGVRADDGGRIREALARFPLSRRQAEEILDDVVAELEATFRQNT